MIKQEELEKYQKAIEKLVARDAKTALIKAALKDLKSSLLQRLGAKEKVEKGSLLARIRITAGTASVSWKGVVTKLKGATYVQMLLTEAKVHAEDVKHLEVERAE